MESSWTSLFQKYFAHYFPLFNINDSVRKAWDSEMWKAPIFISSISVKQVANKNISLGTFLEQKQTA